MTKLEKYYCNTCKCFVDEVYETNEGVDYLTFDEVTGSYEYGDSSDSSGTGNVYCLGCHDSVSMKEVVTNRWEGEPRDEQRRKNILVSGL